MSEGGKRRFAYDSLPAMTVRLMPVGLMPVRLKGGSPTMSVRPMSFCLKQSLGFGGNMLWGDWLGQIRLG